ncbi:LysR family transcriptional regulator [Photobacterium angustum]|uniref:LysR family transcriptional regulator n=1 Tax=Photobacterium angustum TaxID=661 RepID=UPI0005E3A0D0|nr:LysR family transcriptional regulator [Photobacterium angustum]KJG18904.1 transcriptional regulator [Photobacterium angustum]KJG25405.1 transcriptional regulator [Photobacterium angustum]KJG33720.1 transcriptional regulator [Photobacterium angustum]PSW95864.1 LysR family transcriptional regulator [Photobacterium angustum]PSX02248.1 LysR family transcriptional regulator [Photobacterium angustum]
MLLEGIETLLVLAEEGTMSRTGSRLYISQSAVSKRIAKLEVTLGTKLIIPAGRLIKLTPDAHALINNVGPSFNEIRGLIFEHQNLDDQSIITIDCSETLVAGYLSQAMGQYFQHDKYISITTHHTPVIVENVQSGKASIGFCAGHLPAQYSFIAQHLMNEPFKLVFNQPLTALPKAILVNDLKNPANISQAAVLQKLGIIPLMEMDSYTAAAQLGLAGVAPALVPDSIIKTLKIEEKFCFQFKELTELIRPISLIYRQNSYKLTRVKNLVDTIADLFT